MASAASAQPPQFRDLDEVPGRVLGPQHFENKCLDDEGRRKGLEFSSAVQFRGHILVSDDETRKVEHDALDGKDRKGLALMELVLNDAQTSFTLRRPWTEAFKELPRFDDIECMTARYRTLYLMGSHSRNSAGEPKPQREVLIRLVIDKDGSARATHRPTGLRSAIVDAIVALGGGTREAVDRALNLEGLSMAGDSEDFLVGVKAPLVNGRAVVLRIKAPDEFLDGKAEALHFEVEHSLDLGGAGISSMEWDPVSGYYLIASSRRDDAKGTAESSLWRWPGALSSATEVARFQGHALEGLCRLDEGPLKAALLLGFDNEWVGKDGLTHSGGTVLVVRGGIWDGP